MTPESIEWIANYICQEIQGKERRKFLDILKRDPLKAASFVRKNLKVTCAAFTKAHQKSSITVDIYNDPIFIVERLKVLLKDELSRID